MKKKQPEQSVRKFKETYIFTHKDISIYVKIDYRNNKISLVEPYDKGKGQFQGKEWLFKDRGVEFMSGWLNILEAMQEAIKDARKRYEADHAENSKFLEDTIIKGVVFKNKKS